MVMRMREVFSSSWVALHTSQEACVVLLLEKPEVLLRASSPRENNLPFRGVAGRLRLVRAGIMAPTHPDYLHLWFLAWSYRKVTLQTDAVETKITNPYTRATNMDLLQATRSSTSHGVRKSFICFYQKHLGADPPLEGDRILYLVNGRSGVYAQIIKYTHQDHKPAFLDLLYALWVASTQSGVQVKALL